MESGEETDVRLCQNWCLIVFLKHEKAHMVVLTVVDEMCFFSISAQRQTSGLTACAEYPFARVCHAAEFRRKRPAVAKYRDTARQAAANTERP